ncbi:hypothetical protein SNE40_016846 [Patella caerulea]|uniref:Medium-chain acyl-CoA ligase ACSF2, mitochondrial n=1 Tax=Patella caerulea TaxID=87958 RepID=A0AAN8PCZ1_PATCE
MSVVGAVSKFKTIFCKTRFQWTSTKYRYCSNAGAEKLKWSYVHGNDSQPLLGITIGKALQNTVERNPTKEAVVFYDDGIRKTNEQLLEDVDQFATGLANIGLKRGDRIGIWGPNRYEWIVTQYASARLGLILVNINPQYKQNELEYALRKVGCKALVSAVSHQNQDYYEMLFNIIPELATDHPNDIKSHLLPQFKTLIMMGESRYRGALRFSEISEAGGSKERDYILDLQDKLQFDDPINILFTSGTTGSPKGVTLSHHNITNNSHTVGIRLGYHQRESRICCPIPLYHSFGLVLGSLSICMHGACVVFPAASFKPELTLQAVQVEKCTSLYGVPTMFIDMLTHPNFNNYNFSSLCTGVMGGSPCPIEVMKEVNTKMNMTEVIVSYGLTETSPVTFSSFRDSPIEKRLSTVGLPGSHVEAKVINENGNIVRTGVSGQLCSRGYTTMLGYWEDPDKTAEVISPSLWFHTGDIAVIDDEGYCKIVGRIKDMIIRGGENVYPTEIEQILYQHPKVKDVQVVGVPDQRLGEEICACIELKSGETSTAGEIIQYCRQQVARYKVPKYVEFVDRYPLTVTGKVIKFKIREDMKKKLGLQHIHPQ